MKRFLALMFIPAFAIGFAACKKNAAQDGTTTTVAGQSTVSSQSSTAKPGESTTFSSKSANFSSAMNELKNPQKKLVDKIGVSKDKEKIVAYFDDERETAVMVCTFASGKLTKVENYRFYKQENVFNAYKKMAEVKKDSFTIYDSEKCVMQNQTNDYKGMSYDEMIKKLNGYEIKK